MREYSTRLERLEKHVIKADEEKEEAHEIASQGILDSGMMALPAYAGQGAMPYGAVDPNMMAGAMQGQMNGGMMQPPMQGQYMQPGVGQPGYM